MASTPMSPEKIGRYEILGELGRGAMGCVYRAFDPNIRRNVALKTIPLDTADPELARLFLREAQAAGNLSHPNIVTIYDAGEDGSALYIVMELVEGPTLQQILASGPLPVEQVISFCEQTAAALDHAHARAIIHRDIKPGNIMVQAGVAKVADFGVAKDGADGMTSTGEMFGTPSYLAPEVVKGDPADARSDIFSLGVVLYEMLTGRRAFAGDDIPTIFYRIISEQPPAPSLVISSVPPGMNYVVQKALAKEREQRYASCAELVTDLKNYSALEDKGKAAAQQVNAPPPIPDLVEKTAKSDLGSVPLHTQAAPAPSTSAVSISRKKQANSTLRLAILYHSRKDLERAEKLYLEALQGLEKSAEPTDLARCLNNLAVLYSQRRNYQSAKPLYYRSVEILERTLGPHHRKVARRLVNLAKLCDDFGDCDEALLLYRRALLITEKVYGPSAPNSREVFRSCEKLSEKISRSADAGAVEASSVDG